MLVTILNASGVSLCVVALIALGGGRIRAHTGDALFAVGNFLIGVSCVLNGDLFWASVCAAVTAWCAYDWWHKGGGDGTRRRLKSWGRRFQGVRRTAPQGAS